MRPISIKLKMIFLFGKNFLQNYILVNLFCLFAGIEQDKYISNHSNWNESIIDSMAAIRLQKFLACKCFHPSNYRVGDIQQRYSKIIKLIHLFDLHCFDGKFHDEDTMYKRKGIQSWHKKVNCGPK